MNSSSENIKYKNCGLFRIQFQTIYLWMFQFYTAIIGFTHDNNINRYEKVVNFRPNGGSALLFTIIKKR